MDKKRSSLPSVLESKNSSPDMPATLFSIANIAFLDSEHVFNIYLEINKNIPSKVFLYRTYKVENLISTIKEKYQEHKVIANKKVERNIEKLKSKLTIPKISESCLLLSLYDDKLFILIKQSRTEVHSGEYLSLCDSIEIFYNQDYFKELEEFQQFCLTIPVYKRKNNILPKIKIVHADSNGVLFLREHSLNKLKLSVTKNYNDDFEIIHNRTIEFLNKKNSKGIILFYGTPGCGKTNYIKYLTSKLKKDCIYLPPNMANEIASPSFITFLSDFPNHILIIEDGENIIKTRKSGGSQAIANLLNLSDGLLSDILKIQIVVTFNCSISDIDEALLRPGRLITKYEFTPLAQAKAQKLSDSLGYNKCILEDIPLSQIYNQDMIDESKVSQRKPVGFSFDKNETDSKQLYQ